MDCLILRFEDAELIYRKNVDDLPERCFGGQRFKLKIGGIRCTFEMIVRNELNETRGAIFVSRRNFCEVLGILDEHGWTELKKKQRSWVLRKMKEAQKARGKNSKAYSYTK